MTLAQQAAQIAWWHGGMDLGQGVVTRGVSNPARDLLPRLRLPQDLTGKTVLDIGTWDGFMAFECERRNAAKVVAVDSFVWQAGQIERGAGTTGRAGFDLAHKALGSRVEAVVCEVLDLSPDVLGTFDIVLFLGVLYHMRHPLLALEKVAAMVALGGLLLVESHISTGTEPYPMMRFYPGKQLAGDSTNWWGPNAACLEAMLRDVGFAAVQPVTMWSDRAAYHARRSNP
jgi:tRNA (mo5U34)-methyltransferase